MAGGTSTPGGTSSLPTLSGSVVGGNVQVQTASGALATVGGVARVQSSVGSFLVTRTSQQTFMAVTAICTHEQCTITGLDGAIYVCPCHGSRYNTGGQVLSGPATQSLQQFATAFADGVVSITP